MSVTLMKQHLIMALQINVFITAPAKGIAVLDRSLLQETSALKQSLSNVFVCFQNILTLKVCDILFLATIAI
jgi:hypothetical protein